MENGGGCRPSESSRSALRRHWFLFLDSGAAQRRLRARGRLMPWAALRLRLRGRGVLLDRNRRRAWRNDRAPGVHGGASARRGVGPVAGGGIAAADKALP